MPSSNRENTGASRAIKEVGNAEEKTSSAPLPTESVDLLEGQRQPTEGTRPPEAPASVLTTPSIAGEMEFLSNPPSNVPITGAAPPASDPPAHNGKVPTPSPGHQTPASNLSRHPSTSTSGASPFRRPRSQTPSLNRGGTESKRPMSQVFERLKEKSRSLSRSSTKSERSSNKKDDRSRSRPASLVLTNPDLLEEERGDELGELQGGSRGAQRNSSFAVMGVRSTEARVGPWDEPLEGEGAPSGQNSTSLAKVMSMASPQRTEAWNEPDAVIPQTPRTPRKQGDEDRGVGRLGVLPSPAPTNATFESGRRASQEVAKRRSSNAPLGSVGSADMMREDLGLATVPSAEEFGQEEETERERPNPIRRSSDLGGLPSQQQMTTTKANEEEAGGEQATADEGVSPTTARRSLDQSPEDASPTGSSPTTGRRSIDRPKKHLPQYQRRISDLALLPSQRRRTLDSQPAPPSPQTPHSPRSPVSPTSPTSPKTTGRPDSQTLVPLTIPSTETIDDEVYQASPVTIKPMSPTLLATRIASGDNTPTAARTKGPAQEEEDLYNSTPTAAKTKDVSRASGEQTEAGAGTGHEAEIEKMEQEIQQAVASSPPAVVSPSATSPPPVQVSSQDDKWETRSEVSAEGGAQESSRERKASRSSSVSSLGAHDAADAKDFEAGRLTEPNLQRMVTNDVPIMSSQAVPAGPVTAPSQTQRAQGTPFGALNVPGAMQQRQQSQGGLAPQVHSSSFEDRSYGPRRPQLEERTMSYMPLPRDAQGNIIDETITTGPTEEPQPPPVDLSGIAGPPPGAPPFQQHPVFRNSGIVQPTEYEKLRSSVASGVSSAHTRQSSADAGEAAPKRTSGFFRGTRQTPEESTSSVGAVPPTASRISDQHGLEDVHAFDDVPSDLPPSRQGEEKQSRRRSGIWDALTSRRSSSAAKIDASRENSLAAREIPQGGAQSTSQRPVEDTSKQGTLRKPQRASTNAIELEPKKKRFSKLGSLFGRSNTTTGQEKSKPNRLSKVNRTDSSRKQETIQENRPIGPSTVRGDVANYEAYEAMRRRDMPAFQENTSMQRTRSGNAPPERPHPPSQGPDSSAPPDMQPPPGGWYAPENNRDRGSGKVEPSRGPPLPEFRRLHSSGQRSSRPIAQVPEAFRPVESGFHQSVQPIGPPPDDQAAFRGFSSSNVPTQSSFAPDRQIPPGAAVTPSERMDAMMDPARPPPRNPSYGSDVSQFSPGMSGRSDYWPPGSRPLGSEGSISPVQPQYGSGGYPTPREQRVGSIGYEIGRSPAQEYVDQQTPWAISMPRASEGGRQPSWSMRPDERRMSGQGSGMRSPPPGHIYQQQQPPYLAMQAYGSPSLGGINYNPHAQGRPTRIPWEEQQPVRQAPPPHAPHYHPDATTYPSPPYSPHHASRQRGSQYHQHIYQQQQQQQRPMPPPQNRYYSSGPPPRYQDQGPPGIYKAPGSQQRRPSSGYEGRRDDPAVGEEELIMRGASYPGQEWTPAGLGRGGWD